MNDCFIVLPSNRIVDETSTLLGNLPLTIYTFAGVMLSTLSTTLPALGS